MISPIDGSVYADRSNASNEKVEATLAQAVIAERAWKQVPVAERAEKRVELLRTRMLRSMEVLQSMASLFRDAERWMNRISPASRS